MAVIGNDVRLDVAASLAGAIFEPAPRRVKGVTNRDMCVFVGVISTALAADSNFAARQLEIDAYRERFALVMMPVLALDCHVAGSDSVIELIKFPGALHDARFQRRRCFHVPKRNLQR